MIGRRMALIYGKAAVVIFVLCFAVVQLASVRNRTSYEQAPPLVKPDQMVSADNKIMDHVPIPVSDKGQESVISEKEGALKFERINNSKSLDSDRAKGIKHEPIVKEEAHILGRGDIGLETNKQNQLQKPNNVNNFEGVQGVADLHIEEPKEKVNIQVSHVIILSKCCR